VGEVGEIEEKVSKKIFLLASGRGEADWKGRVAARRGPCLSRERCREILGRREREGKMSGRKAVARRKDDLKSLADKFANGEEEEWNGGGGESRGFSRLGGRVD